MIIYHQNNVAAFAGNHVYYWGFQPLRSYRVSVTSSSVATSIPIFAHHYMHNIGGAA